MEPEASDELPIRLADRDRDAVVTQLNDAMSEGRISVVEFEQRTRQAYAATYPADLVPLTADLPPTTALEPASAPRPGPDASPRATKPRWVVSIMGGTEKRGAWDPGASVNSVTLMGGTVLDLTEVAAAEVTINAFTMMAATEIIVPRGATVDLSGFILMGGSSDETSTAGDSTMRVTINSFGLMGGCEVRHLKPKEEAKRLEQGQ